MYVCNICGLRFPVTAERAWLQHVTRCVQRNEEFVDSCRPSGQPYEGDPEMLAFALAEGDVFNRRPGTRRRPR